MIFPIDMEWTGSSIKGLRVRFIKGTPIGSEVLFIPDGWDDDIGSLVVGGEYSGYPPNTLEWKELPRKLLNTYKIKDFE